MEDQAYNINNYLIALKEIRKHSTTGSRLPLYIKELIDMFDMTAQGADAEETQEPQHLQWVKDSYLHPELQKLQFLSSATASKPRFLLRRRSSSAASTSTAEYDSEDEVITPGKESGYFLLQDLPDTPAKKAKTSQDPKKTPKDPKPEFMAWYSDCNDTGHT